MTGPDTQTRTDHRRDPWVVGFFAAAGALLLTGLVLMYTGAGVDLGQERTVLVTVHAIDLPRESLGRVKIGDLAYSEPAGMPIGRVTGVVEGPMIAANADASGTLRASPDPVKAQMDVTIESTGRRGKDVTAVGSQVVSVGQWFAFYTSTTYVEGIAVRLDVR
jgi:hypothetical protein